jgi:hypothetical protein
LLRLYNSGAKGWNVVPKAGFRTGPLQDLFVGEYSREVFSEKAPPDSRQGSGIFSWNDGQLSLMQTLPGKPLAAGSFTASGVSEVLCEMNDFTTALWKAKERPGKAVLLSPGLGVSHAVVHVDINKADRDALNSELSFLSRYLEPEFTLDGSAESDKQLWQLGMRFSQSGTLSKKSLKYLVPVESVRHFLQYHFAAGPTRAPRSNTTFQVSGGTLIYSGDDASGTIAQFDNAVSAGADRLTLTGAVYALSEANVKPYWTTERSHWTPTPDDGRLPERIGTFEALVERCKTASGWRLLRWSFKSQ